MMKHPHNQMDLLTQTEVDRIHQVTDRLQLHRDWVVVPLNAAEKGLELLQPDGKLLIRPPAGEEFEPWLWGLEDRLLQLELGRIPRSTRIDPKFDLTGPGEFPAFGTRRYLGGRGILRR